MGPLESSFIKIETIRKIGDRATNKINEKTMSNILLSMIPSKAH